MTIVRLRWVFVVSLVGLGLIATSTAEATFTGNPGRIAYAEVRHAHAGSHRDIYVVNPDGRFATPVTNTKQVDEFPASWSPDGTRLAYTTDAITSEGFIQDLYVIDFDGTDQVQITDTPDRPEYDVEFSPDGTKLAFLAEDANGALDIHVVNVDGTGEQPLTTGGIAGFGMSWAPDGSSIVFARIETGGLSSVNVSTKAVTTLTQTGYSPDHSPDGAKIAYSDSSEDTINQLFVANADGSQPNMIFQAPTRGSLVLGGWAPDGSKLLFQVTYGRGDFEQETRTIEPDGTGYARVSDNVMVGPWQPCTTDCASSKPTPTQMWIGVFSGHNTRGFYGVGGELDPAHDGAEVSVKLFVKKGGDYVLFDSGKGTIDEEEHPDFEVRLNIPDGDKRCKAVAKFAGDGDHTGSRATDTFPC